MAWALCVCSPVERGTKLFFSIFSAEGNAPGVTSIWVSIAQPLLAGPPSATKTPSSISGTGVLSSLSVKRSVVFWPRTLATLETCELKGLPEFGRNSTFSAMIPAVGGNSMQIVRPSATALIKAFVMGSGIWARVSVKRG